MPQSLHSNFAHIIFSTKNREPLITEDVTDRVHAYLTGIVKDQGAVPVSVNGMPDHVHLLIKTSKNVADAKFMKDLKGGSSTWVNEESLVQGKFQWQAGYGWFSASPKDTEAVVAYIQNQAEHHQFLSFQDEFRRFLKTYQVAYNERYVWD